MKKIGDTVSISPDDALLGQETNTQGDKQAQLFDKPGGEIS